jgi:hypothetical protein
MDFENILKLLVFLILVAGGIISDVIKKDKANKRAEDDIDEARAETPQNRPQPQPRAAPTAPGKKPAAPKPVKSNSRAEDPEWAATLADRKRREAAKAAEKLAPKSEDFEPDVAGILINRLREPELPLALSAQQARDGIVMAEILGPPVSMR